MDLDGGIISLLDDDSNDDILGNTLAVMSSFEINKPIQSEITFESDTDFPDSPSEDDSETYKHEKRTKLPLSKTKKSRYRKIINATNEIYSHIKIKTEPETLNDETLCEVSSSVEKNSKTFVSESLKCEKIGFLHNEKALYNDSPHISTKSLTTGSNTAQIQKQVKATDSDLSSSNVNSKEKSFGLDIQNKKALNFQIKVEPLDYDLIHHGNKNSNQMLNNVKEEQVDAKSLRNESAKCFLDIESENNNGLKLKIKDEPLEETNVLHKKDANENISEFHKVVKIEPDINTINMIPVNNHNSSACLVSKNEQPVIKTNTEFQNDGILHKATSQKQDVSQTSSNDTNSETNQPTNTFFSNPQYNSKSEVEINKSRNFNNQNMNASENYNQITFLIKNILDVLKFIGQHEHGRENLKKSILSGNEQLQLEFRKILFLALMKSSQVVESLLLLNKEYKNQTFIRYLSNTAKGMAIDEHQYFDDKHFLKILCYFIKSCSLTNSMKEKHAEEKQNHSHANDTAMKHQNHILSTAETINHHQLLSERLLKENTSHTANPNPARTLNINGILVEIPPIVTAQCAVNKKLNDGRSPDIALPGTRNNTFNNSTLPLARSNVHYQYGNQLISNSVTPAPMISALNRNLQQNSHQVLQNQIFSDADKTRKYLVKHVSKRRLSVSGNIQRQTSSESNILPAAYGTIRNSQPTNQPPSHTSKSHLYQASNTFHHPTSLSYQDSSSDSYHQSYSTAYRKTNPASYAASNPAAYKVSNPASYPVSNSLSYQASNLHSRASNPPSYQSLGLPSYHVSNPPAYKSTNPPSYRPFNSLSYLVSNHTSYNASNQPSHPAPNTPSYPVLNSPAYQASNFSYPAVNPPSYPVSRPPPYQTSNTPSHQAPNMSSYPTSNPPSYQMSNRSHYPASTPSICQPQPNSTANTSRIGTHTKLLQSPNFYPGPTHYRHLINQPVSQIDKNQTYGTNYEQKMNHPNCDPASQLNQTRISNTDQIRSSISRDSGFMSPSRSGSSDQTMLSGYDVPQLTALNADRTCNTKLNSCIVCGKGTLQKCGRCFTISVCGSFCMEVAWNTHNFVCKRKSTNT